MLLCNWTRLEAVFEEDCIEPAMASNKYSTITNNYTNTLTFISGLTDITPLMCVGSTKDASVRVKCVRACVCSRVIGPLNLVLPNTDLRPYSVWKIRDLGLVVSAAHGLVEKGQYQN